MAKATKKTVKKSVKPSSPVMAPVMPMSEPMMVSAPRPKMNNKFLTLALFALGLGLLAYKVGPYLVPAVVGSTPVTRFEIWRRLEQSYGTQTLDDLVNEKILDAAIAKSGIKVEQSQIDEQIKTLEAQFTEVGGLDEALKQRGLTRTELTKQVVTQLSVEEILKDKVNPSDEEVQKVFADGATTTYKDKKFDDVKAGITEELKQTKLRDEFLAWFAEVKKDAKVKTFGI